MSRPHPYLKDILVDKGRPAIRIWIERGDYAILIAHFFTSAGTASLSIHIAFAQQQAELAQQISADLAGAPGPADAMLIALISRQSSGDPVLLAEVERARRQGQAILPVLLDDAAMPSELEGLASLDMRRGYDRRRLLAHIARMGSQDAGLRRANRRGLAIFGGLAALMFVLAILAISGGHVAFPVDEYNEEATLQAQWIGGLVNETLEYVQPRSTQEAANFAATYALAPTRLRMYIRGTATALAKAG